MSLTIIKSGLLDTVQDEGRYGFQSSGINPGGAMDAFSARLANCLLGKPMNSAFIEMHFPAAAIAFGEPAVICITGADFTPAINNSKIELNQPVVVNKGSVLQCTKCKQGARSYLSILNNFVIKPWLNSYSTNLAAGAGGYHGRALRTGDVIPFENIDVLNDILKGKAFKVMPWKAIPPGTLGNTIEVISGSEWNWLDEESQQAFVNSSFVITKVADRMGYRLFGKTLHVKEPKQLLSSAVTFGTLQLLPSGQLIVLMADHQTTGGYPRVANAISAHLPLLAQAKPNETISFQFTNVAQAEQKLLLQFNYLQQVQHAAQFKIEKLVQ